MLERLDSASQMIARLAAILAFVLFVKWPRATKKVKKN
jgi:hypothetical protein